MKFITYNDSAMVLLHKLTHYHDILSLFALIAENLQSFNEVSQCIHPLGYLLFAYFILKKNNKPTVSSMLRILIISISFNFGMTAVETPSYTMPA
jgi:hypothetical protein